MCLQWVDVIILFLTINNGLLQCGTLVAYPLIKYYGDKFFMTVEKVNGILVSMYAKYMKKSEEEGTASERYVYPTEDYYGCD